MITSIQLQSYKGHLDTTIPLGRLTILVGPNGAGKTSVLQALQLMARLMKERPLNVLSAEMRPQDLLHRASDWPITITVQGIDEQSPWHVAMDLSTLPPHERLYPDDFRLALEWRYGGEGTNRREKIDSAVPFQEVWGRGSNLARVLGPAMLYHFDARQIAAASYSTEENPTLEEDGSNTAVVLAALKLEREEAFEQIESELRKIVPNIQRVRVRRIRMSQQSTSEIRVGNKIFLDFKGASDVPAHAASEGTLVSLALLTALCSPNRPQLLLLDDIDQSLHPQAQMELMRELKRLLESFPTVQLVATTHSPYILDELDPADIRVFALRQDGSVACRSLSEHPQAEKMRGALTAGQLWSLDPEWRWVIEEG
jgi:predicted ATPase